MRLNNLDFNIYERMFNLLDDSLLFISVLNMQLRIPSDIFKEVLSV